MSQFEQGDIVWFDFPRERWPQFTIKNRHPALILHDYTHPNQTIVIAPLSSLHDQSGTEKEIQSYHLKLLKRDYPALSNDSYVKLDQIMTFSRNKVNVGNCICSLSDKDIAATHLKLIESLQMHDTIREITKKQIEKTVEEMLERYIQDILKDTDSNNE